MCGRFHLSAACGWLLIALIPCGAACSKKPERAGPEKPAEAAEKTETGVGDVVDYFTGRTPLRIKKQMEEKIDRITREHEKQLQELLGADEGAARPAGGEKPRP